MLIKPENKLLYPPNWKEIRAEILERAGNKCEKCGIANYSIGRRDENGKFIPVENSCQSEVDAEENGWRIFKIVLTIAHVDHDPRNNGVTGNRPNLLALCQMDHLRLDANHHAINSRKTRNEKLGRISLDL